MHKNFFLCFAVSLVGFLISPIVYSACSDLLDYKVRRLAETDVDHLCHIYAHDVVLVVNTASKCGYTPQFEALEQLYQKYKERGFTILGFPSKDFGGQEYDEETKTAEFCHLTYGVQFPMYAHTHSRKGLASSLFVGLAEAAGGEYPRWNFHKYVINRTGSLVGSLDASVGPKQLEKLILDSLDQ